jgi:hypothetical protein
MCVNNVAASAGDGCFLPFGMNFLLHCKSLLSFIKLGSTALRGWYESSAATNIIIDENE